jgi:hypothetical protein
VTVDGGPKSGIAELVEDTQLTTTQQGRHASASSRLHAIFLAAGHCERLRPY